MAVVGLGLEARSVAALPTESSGVAQIDKQVAAETSRAPGRWLIVVGAAGHGGDVSLPSSADEWWGGSGAISAGRVLNDVMTVALNVQVQYAEGLRNGFFKTAGSAASTGELGLVVVAGSIRLQTARLGNVPILGLLGGIESGYLRTDIGYTRARQLDEVGRVEDEFSWPIVRRFEGGKNGLYLLGGLGFVKWSGNRWGISPELAVEYHQFSGWYAVMATFGVFFDIRL